MKATYPYCNGCEKSTHRSDLNHRFTATFMWPATDADTISSGRPDLPYTATSRWFRLPSICIVMTASIRTTKRHTNAFV